MKADSEAARPALRARVRLRLSVIGTLAGTLFVPLAPLAVRANQKSVSWPAPAFASQWKLAAGSGSDYSATCHWSDESTVRLAIVGREQAANHEAYWLEISSHRPTLQDSFIMKTLFYPQGRKVVFTRTVVQLPGHPPVELPQDWMFEWTRGALALAAGYIEPYGPGAPVSESQKEAAGFVFPAEYPLGYFRALTIYPSELPKARRAGAEIVRTPGGIFASERWRFGAPGEPWRPFARPIEVWISEGAGPFALVEAKMRDRYGGEADLNLIRVVANAQDQIAGRPEPVPVDKLWTWMWEQRHGVLSVCFPQVGLPPPGPGFVR